MSEFYLGEAADPHESVRLSREALFKRGIGEGFRAVLEALNGHESALQHYEALYSGAHGEPHRNRVGYSSSDPKSESPARLRPGR